MQSYDAKGMCPKCGEATVTTVHYPEIKYANYGGERVYTHNGESVLAEHLKRCCTRCRYQWPEAIIEEQADRATSP